MEVGFSPYVLKGKGKGKGPKGGCYTCGGDRYQSACTQGGNAGKGGVRSVEEQWPQAWGVAPVGQARALSCLITATNKPLRHLFGSASGDKIKPENSCNCRQAQGHCLNSGPVIPAVGTGIPATPDDREHGGNVQAGGVEVQEAQEKDDASAA